MKRLAENIPLPISGLMLALAATGNLVSSYGSIFRNILGSLSALILLLIVIKICTDYTSIARDLKNPVIAGVSPTLSMGVMILSTYIKQHSPSLAFGLWITALLIHCTLIIYFTVKFIFNFNIKQVFPSYFVVYVGIVVGSVTAPAYNLTKVGQLLFWLGLIFYFILLPVVAYRVLVIRSIKEPALPTIAIFAAPSSLCLAGYMSTFPVKNAPIIYFLTLLSIVMTFSVLSYMPKMLKIKFYPSYSAFTFPFVISAIAIKKVDAFINGTGSPIPLLKYTAVFEELWAVSIVIYVLIRYSTFIFAGLTSPQSVRA